MIKLLHILILCWIALSVATTTWAADSGPKDHWPAFSLPAPSEKVQRDYLGLDGRSDFSVAEINAEFVLVQIFSMYCPICQREASRVNQLYEAVRQREDLSRRLKIIGIGAGNSAYEVDFYRRNYGVAFPLFADGDYDIHQLLGEVGTPYFFLIHNRSGSRPRIVHKKEGGFESSEAFMAQLLKIIDQDRR